jgi:LuxR family transcriptional regulator, maltose regulon positive regulatory protein
MSKPFAPWLLSSKVSPPRISINANRRERLLATLSENIEKRVILLEAPAGFGKTLLLSQWREGLRTQGSIVAWLSVSQNDQSDILPPYIAFAFHQAGLDTGATGLLSPKYNQGDSSYLLGNLLSLVEQSKKKCVLVFDDFENISADALLEIVQPILSLQANNLQLVFACRKNPGISLSSLAVEGNVLNIGSQQLMFDKKEIDHFFQNSLGNTEIDNIIERTGGWPVALQLIRSFGSGSTKTSGCTSSKPFGQKAI